MNKLKASVLAASAALMSGQAFAQSAGGTVTGGIVSALCSVLSPFVGKQSQILSLLFIIGLAAMVLLWFLNENKEGVLVWVLRAGIAIGVLINIFSAPVLFGLPSPCGAAY